LIHLTDKEDQMGLLCLSNEIASSVKGILKSDLELWRQAGYAAVDKLVERLKNQIEGKDVEDVSNLLREEGKSVTAAIFEQMINSLGKEELQAKKHACPECNKTLKLRNMRRSIDTQHGRIALQRPYFYCKPCHRGSYPFDEKLGIAPTYKQYDLQKPAARLLAEVPFERASQLYKELTGNEMSNHAMHDLADNLAAASDIVRVLPSRKMVEATIEKNSNGKIWRPIVVILADGAHLPTRPEAANPSGRRGPGEWREVKGFRIYLVGQERITQIMSWHEIADEKEFGEALQFAATLIPVDRVRIALVADGAPWIWNHLKNAFPKGKEILDYYHCSEHIHKVAEIQYKEDENQQVLWIESTMARLNEGDVGSVIWGLQRMNPASSIAGEEIRKLIVYLEKNAHRIDYKAAKRGQYPRGSGGIESANKFICHVRMKRSGAWWYVINGNAMLRLRCSLYNGTFDID
jgi:Uncharacterised protein family (UPF0236)